MDTAAIKDAFQSGGEEFHYRDDNVDLGGHASGETSIHIGHFVVRREARGQNIATTVLNALEDVMHEQGYSFLTIEIQATDADDRDDLNDGDFTDPTAVFLRKRGFRDIEPTEDWQWGLCFEAYKTL